MRFAVVWPWWGYALAFAAAVLLGWLAYARVPIKLQPGSRIGLSALRALTLILLIAILLRPVVMVPPAAAKNSVLPVLVDISRSMRLHDSEGPVAPRARAGNRARPAGAAGRRISARAADVWRSADRRDRRRSPRPDGAAERSERRDRRSRRTVSAPDFARERLCELRRGRLSSLSPARSCCRTAATPPRPRSATGAASMPRCSRSGSAVPTRRAIARSSISPPASRCCPAPRSTSASRRPAMASARIPSSCA